ncbi:hypothetical protein M153_3830003056 [Pseudoloma neurophilia]|uniref:Uncharacterized protein n=1 Tax=Pseudoloma neurophilia TaxID=146866 RepID=A0A0R0LXP8_9MICR|nr:hypothetical protein M153_3830003056 [Pseudoloma neurophilia]
MEKKVIYNIFSYKKTNKSHVISDIQTLLTNLKQTVQNILFEQNIKK